MEAYVERKPGTMWREQFEADPRDYLVENTIGTPSEEDLKNLPDSVNLLEDLPRTYDQGSLGACTAYALTHIQLYNNCKDFDSMLVELDPLSLWVNMGHDPSNKNEGGDYLENALKFSKSKGINGKKPDGKSFTFLSSSYAFKNVGTGTERDFNIIKYYLSKGMPLYTAIRGTSKTRRELSAGELTTVFPASETTGGHAISFFGIDKDYIYVANSRSGKPKSTFKIARSTYTEMIKQGMTSWRYWIIYDKKDNIIATQPLFDDYIKEESTEEYKAVKWCKDNGIIKGSNGKLLPEVPLTREQICLILYRFANMPKVPAPEIAATIKKTGGASKAFNSEPRP